ncbi:hypothetical protein L0991_04185 [Vibrio chagasii]|uniref:hypothetical protein n=1 Tax=Vibrio chagasii TaxID=170679 RepID=UPI0035A65E87
MDTVNKIMLVLNNWSFMVILVVAVIALILKNQRCGTGEWALFGAFLVVIAVTTYSIIPNNKVSVFDYPNVLITSVFFLALGARFIGEWLTEDAKENTKKAREEREKKKLRQEEKEKKREQRELNEIVLEAQNDTNTK